MKNKIVLAVLFLAVILGSCGSIKYLPNSAEIDMNQYGSFIKVSKKTTGISFSGELLALDSNNIFVLIDSLPNISKRTVIIPIAEVANFKLQYANTSQYGWTIPAGIILPLIPFPDPDDQSSIMPFHGFFALLTIPVNLIVTIAITAAAQKQFKYTNKNISIDQLRMFARFPQGIPPNIDIAKIK